MIILPCRHSLCGSCALTIVETRRRTCPFCNQTMMRIWPTSFDIVPRKSTKDLVTCTRESVALRKSAPNNNNNKDNTTPNLNNHNKENTTPPNPPVPSSAVTDVLALDSDLFEISEEEFNYSEIEPFVNAYVRQRLLQEGFHFEQPSSPSSFALDTQQAEPQALFYLDGNAFPLEPPQTNHNDNTNNNDVVRRRTSRRTPTTTTTTTTTTEEDPFKYLTMWEMSEGGFQGVSFRVPQQERRRTALSRSSSPQIEEEDFEDLRSPRREKEVIPSSSSSSLLSEALAELRQSNDESW